jgi:hypothetical protein
MKKVYNRPETEVVHVQTQQMLAVSVGDVTSSGLDVDLVFEKESEWNTWEEAQ